MSTPFFPQWRPRLAPLGRTIRKLRRASLSELEAFFATVFPAVLLDPTPSGPNSRTRVFTQRRTFWLLLFQAFKPRTSLREAVLWLQALLGLHSEQRLDSASSAYSQARGRLPVRVLEESLELSAEAARRRAPDGGSIGGRPVKVVDATSAQLADTPENQKEFPQPGGQAKGCGFPVMKIMALFCLASGAILKVATTSLRCHDARLFRRLWDWLEKDDILMGDRAFGDYITLASLPERGVDVVCRLHQGRSPNFRRVAKRLGRGDALFEWERPLQRPKSVTKRQFARVSERITVRILRVKVRVPGCRTQKLFLATTLLDPVRYPAGELVELYRRRWRIELCFRDLKTTMGMEELRCQSPEMARKEMLSYLVAHNLVRILMAEAGAKHGVRREELSFKASIDAVRQFGGAMARAGSTRTRRRIRKRLYEAIAGNRVPRRPGRREPRAVKRRPKPYPRLTKPSHLYRDRSHPNRWPPKNPSK